MRKYYISSIIATIYIILILLLGFGIKDDFFMLAIPMLFIVCGQYCSTLTAIIATIANGIIVWLIALIILTVSDKIMNR
ncbi:MAG: hypothetical protein ABIF88_02945 [archaeon]